jgi:hypothetical protein
VAEPHAMAQTSNALINTQVLTENKPTRNIPCHRRLAKKQTYGPNTTDRGALWCWR